MARTRYRTRGTNSVYYVRGRGWVAQRERPAPTPANAPPLSAAVLPPKLRLLGRRRHGPPNPAHLDRTRDAAMQRGLYLDGS